MQEPAPVDLLPELRSVYSDRYREDSTTATVALLPDTAAAPLYDVDVRRAIGQALDPETLVRLYDGHLAPSCNLLPEPVQGYRQLDPCPNGDLNEPADLAAAREAIEEAAPPSTALRVEGAEGVPAPVLAYVASTLRKIGLSARAGAGPGAVLRVERIAPLVAHPSAYLDRFDAAGRPRAQQRAGHRRGRVLARGGCGGLGRRRRARRQRGLCRSARLRAPAAAPLGAHGCRELRARAPAIRPGSGQLMPELTLE